MKSYDGQIFAWRAFKIEHVFGRYESHTVLTSLLTLDYTFNLLGENEASTMIDCSYYPRPYRLMLHERDGFNSFKSLKKLNAYVKSMNFGSVVYGKVLVYGEVVEHRLGYRSTKLRIDSLYCPHRHQLSGPCKPCERYTEGAGWPLAVIPTSQIPKSEYRLKPKIQKRKVQNV